MSVDSYFDNLKNPKHLDDMLTLRKFLQKELPNAEENLNYNMPTYVHDEDFIVAVASQKNYMSLYMDMELVENTAMI